MHEKGEVIMHGTMYRSRINRKIGGVCGGFGEYFNVDPTIIRLIWAVSILLFGTGLLVYLIAWAVMPDAPN
jgi:phage shock protein C